MTATSSNPADSVVYITSALPGQPGLAQQGSGVLVAPDEVLTVAHVVYDSQGQLFSDTTVSPGYQRGAVYGVASEQNIHAMPFADYTQLANGQLDFALIHLATPITDVPVMAIGSDFTGGGVTVTGYPAATSGAQDSLQETISQTPGLSLLQGTPLGAPGNAHGASGGPAWETVHGVPTVVGLTDSEAGSTGYFVQLTASDVSQIAAWIAQDHSGTSSATTTPPQAQASAPPTTQVASAALSAPAQTNTAVTSPTLGQAIAFLSGDAGDVHAIASNGSLIRAASKVFKALKRGAASLNPTASFDVDISKAQAWLGDNSRGQNLAASLLEGLSWGHDGGSAGSLIAGIGGSDPGLVEHNASIASAKAGFRLGQDLLAHGA